MITPDFKVDQTKEHIVLQIRLPYVKISKADFMNDEHSFRFYLKPYFLSLTFEESLVPEKISSAVYHHETYLLDLKIEKKTPGEKFKNLQMINKLMARPKPQEFKRKASGPLVQVLESHTTNPNEENKESKENGALSREKEFGYGFLYQSIDFFGRYESELYSLSQINPDQVPIAQRAALRFKSEQCNFNPEHFLADSFGDDPQVESILKDFTVFPWTGELNEEERKELKDLGCKEVLYTEKDVQSALNQLCDIIFAFLFEFKTSEGEFTSESGTNIGFLSSSFSFFTHSESLEETLKTCYRRVLCFGVYRTFPLCEQTYSALKRVFSNGRAAILQCLIRLRKTFLKCEPNYLFNILFIDPLIFFVQQETEETIQEMNRKMASICIKKSEIGLKIDIWEKYALEVEGNSDESESESSSQDLSEESGNSTQENKGKPKIEVLNETENQE